MAQTTAIEWTDLSWNPVHGCSKISPGCAKCYAATLSLRYRQTAKPWTPANAGENVTLKPHKLREPLSNARAWRGLGAAAAAAGKTDGKLVFVNSMSDLFHEEVPDEFIAAVFGAMAAADQHTFQVLTKRPERMQAWFEWYREEIHQMEAGHEPVEPALWHLRSLGHDDVAYGAQSECWPLPNVWLGTSIENRRFVHRADLLRQTLAAVRFISAEPLLGPLMPDGRPPDYRCTRCRGDVFGNPRLCPSCGYTVYEPVGAYGKEQWRDGYDGPGLDLTGISWVIVGGESGPRHRPRQLEWARDLRDAAQASGTAYFLKQFGGPRPGGEALLDGREWREFPRVGATSGTHVA